MRKINIFLILSFFLFPFIYAQENDNLQLGEPIKAYLNLNNISTIFKNTGISDIDPYEINSGFVYPFGTGKTAIYISGFLWGAMVDNPTIPNVGGSTYREGLQGGWITSNGQVIPPSDPRSRIYRVRPEVYTGGPPVDLSKEAMDEGKPEPEIRTQYELDWTEWPADLGAPYFDGNNNNQYDPDPASGDIPGVDGASQTVWFVANDQEAGLTQNLYGTLPIGIEYQATIWGYANAGFLNNLLFRKYKLINKTDALGYPKTFEDMYVSMWSDPDIGNSTDDFAGCDTALSMVYGFNAYDFDPIYNPYPPPAIGFSLIKGPTISGNQNLPMTAAYYFTRGDASVTDPVLGSPTEGALRFYRFMQGKIGLTGEPFINPITGLPTSFALSGDPLTGEGWIDGLFYEPGDRRIGLASGPFNMAPGDTQEIVIAEIAALGWDRLQSFKLLKFNSAMAKDAFDNGLEIPSPPAPPSPIATITSTDWKIQFNWSEDTLLVSQIENFNQDGYEFQGYNVYQLPFPEPILESGIKIATFDIVDGVTTIPGIVMDPETGLPIAGNIQNGSDSGIEREFATNFDKISNAYMKVGKKYYFAVSAYTYNPDPQAIPNNSESLVSVFEAEFYENLPGANYGDSIQVFHSQGSGEGNVYVVVDDPTQLKGNDYEVFFNKQTYYRNENGVWVPIPPGRLKNPGDGPDTLTGSTVDIGAVYGPAAGVIELGCYLNLVAPDGNWADGISMTFPTGITIVDAPPFEAGGGWVYPEINGNTLDMGIVNGSQTGNGIFHGGEVWTVFISSFTPPLTIDWIIYDDGWSGGAVNATGYSVIDTIGYLFKTEDHWNLLNITNQDTVLEDQTVIMGFDLYTGEYVGDPVAEGFKISVDVNYEGPTTMSSVKVNGMELNYSETNVWWFNDDFIVCDFTRFGYENGYAATSLSNYGGAGGTLNLNILQQDYEFRWTGVLGDTLINANTITITKSGGSIATLFGASYYSLADHPLNPNPGMNEPFTVRIPFEVWNVDNNEQVNIVWWDRSGDPTISGGAVWNQLNRVYTWVVNTPYSTNLIDVTSQIVADNATWNVVYYLSTFTLGDVTDVIYLGPVTADDKFTFTTPPGVVSVDDENVPTKFQVFQNYPNPFNPATIIRFTLPQQSLVKLEVYDILGQRVAELVNEELTAGTHEVLFNASNLASGVYFYMLNVKDKFFDVKKMILLK